MPVVTHALSPFGAPEPPNGVLPSRVFRKIALRLVPFLMFLYLVAFLDRVNTSFAALTMNRDLGISDTAFGFGAGIFFVGYLLFEIPSNLALVRVGARFWIAFLMVSWGLISVGLGFVHSQGAYIVARFLLGAAESGFFPGVVLYLTGWLPPTVRGGLMSLFLLAIPLSTVAGAPLSVALLGLDGTAHLHGWQWLFTIEGALALIVGLTVPLFLPDSPGQARWLSHEESEWLERTIAIESAHSKEDHGSWWFLVRNRVVQAGSAAYFTLMIGLYAMSFWLPPLLASEGVPMRNTGWFTAIPYLTSAAGMWFLCAHSDRSKERRLHLAGSFVLAAAGMALAASTHVPAISLLGFSLAGTGIFSAMSLFWTVATIRLRGGLTAVAGIAMINALGNTGGFVGPIWMGWLLERTHNYSAGLLSVCIALLVGGGVSWTLSAGPKRSGLHASDAGMHGSS